MYIDVYVCVSFFNWIFTLIRYFCNDWTPTSSIFTSGTEFDVKFHWKLIVVLMYLWERINFLFISKQWNLYTSHRRSNCDLKHTRNKERGRERGEGGGRKSWLNVNVIQIWVSSSSHLEKPVWNRYDLNSVSWKLHLFVGKVKWNFHISFLSMWKELLKIWRICTWWFIHFQIVIQDMVVMIEVVGFVDSHSCLNFMLNAQMNAFTHTISIFETSFHIDKNVIWKFSLTFPTNKCKFHEIEFKP